VPINKVEDRCTIYQGDNKEVRLNYLVAGFSSEHLLHLDSIHKHEDVEPCYELSK
jgi:hypothetical protein